MSMMVSFVLSFFPRDVLDEILNLIESVSEDFPSYSTLAYYKGTEEQQRRAATENRSTDKQKISGREGEA